MLTAFAKGFAQLTDPRIRRLILLTIAIAIGVFVALWIVVGLMLTRMTVFTTGWLDTAVDVLGGAATLVVTLLLFPAVFSAVVGLFLDRIAAIVERRHYPQWPPAREFLARRKHIRIDQVPRDRHHIEYTGSFFSPGTAVVPVRFPAGKRIPARSRVFRGRGVAPCRSRNGARRLAAKPVAADRRRDPDRVDAERAAAEPRHPGCRNRGDGTLLGKTRTARLTRKPASGLWESHVTGKEDR